MVALKLSNFENRTEGVDPAILAKPKRRPIRAEAQLIDLWHPARIHQAMELSVTERRDDGLTAESVSPVWPGQRLALNFGNNPFLPRAGTVVVVDECRVTETGAYELSLSFESIYAA